MNLASFLHSLKEFKDSSLSLPVAPVYSLPSQRWYFSSPQLVPLKKRKENSSFFKYLESFDLFNQQKEVTDKSQSDKNLLCLYQSKDYFDEKIRHVFGKIYMECRSEVQTRQRLRCECGYEPDQKKSVTFGLAAKTINKVMEASKKHFKSQTPVNKEHSINWNQFARIITKQHTTNIWRNEDQLNIYKLPESSTFQSSVFSLVCNDNYIFFSNGNQLQVNQHMKAKAIELSDLVRKKLEQYIWKKVELIFQKDQEISDYEMFAKKAKNLLKICTLKIWFYKKAENNEIYVLGLSDLSFKGVECVIFKDINFKLQQLKLSDENEISTDEIKRYQSQKNDFEYGKLKLQINTQQDPSNFGFKNLITDGRQKLKSIREANALSEIDMQVGLKWKQKQTLKKDQQTQEITQIQCSCCKNLLLANEVVNQITANKIQQVRYLRQMKIGKKEFEPYDFVKVCSQCYSVYIRSYKQSTSKSKSRNGQHTQKAHSFYQPSQKETNSQKINKEASLYICKKIDQINGNSANPSMRRLLRDRSLNLRAKSQLNSSKQGQISSGKATEQKNQKVIYFTKKFDPYTAGLITQNRKKYKTAITNNTQTLELQGKHKDMSKDEIVLQRTFTNKQKATNQSFQKQFMPKSRSFKLKGGPPKHINIINKIIINTTNPIDKTAFNPNFPKFKQTQLKKWQENLNQVTQSEYSLVGDEKSQKVQKSRDTVITNAIEEYESINRPSFKKLLYKNHRNVIKRDININTEDVWQGMQENKRKKSIFSYCEQLG